MQQLHFAFSMRKRFQAAVEGCYRVRYKCSQTGAPSSSCEEQIQTVRVTNATNVEAPAAPYPRQQISRISDEVTPVNFNILSA